MTALDLVIDQAALAELCQGSDLSLVILFGSRARGLARLDSDTDVGILGREGLVTHDQFDRLFMRLSDILRLPEIDLVDLRRAPPLLKYSAAHHGRALYEDEPGRFNLFHVLAWKLYLDDRIQLRRFDALYVRRFLEQRQVVYESAGISRHSA